MLTAAQLDGLPSPILELYERFHTSIIRDIARRVAGLYYSSAAWQVQRLSESGLLYQEVVEKVSVLTGESEEALKKIFEQAGVKAMSFDDGIYRKAGLRPLPLNLSPQMMQVLVAGLQKTSGLMRNLTGTTAVAAQEAFLNASDLAYMQISSGALDYNTAIREAVSEVAREGVDVIYFASGHRDTIDVVMRRAVLTGVNQTTGEMQLARADEMGAELMQTSAHIGARNKGVGPANHEGWQGKVFSLKGATKEYPNFEEVTGWGTVTGLGGINCRHSFYPFFKGISKNAYDQATLNECASKTVTYQGEEISVYEATQKQRAIERETRKAKREAAAVDSAGLDNSGELQRVRDYQAKMREFTRETGLSRQRAREQILSRNTTPHSKQVFTESLRRLTKPENVIQIGDIQEEKINSWSPITTKTVLTGERRLHYLQNHPEIEAYELKLFDLIQSPDEIHKDVRDTDMAIFYKIIDKNHALRAAVWISKIKGLSNSVHSLRLANISELVRGVDKGLRKWIK